MEKILNKCPVCDSKLQYCRLMSFTIDSIIKRNGELSVKETKSDVGSMETGFIACTNRNCGFITDGDLVCDNYRNIKIKMKDEKFYYEDIDDEE